MKKSYVMIITIGKRSASAPKVQTILSENSKFIDLRYGVHEKAQDKGLILLKVKGARSSIDSFSSSLNELEDVKSQYIEL